MKKKWTNKSKLTEELILKKITENTTKYTWSNLCINNEMLLKIDDTGFYLFYTGGNMKIRSLYWTYLYVQKEGKASTLYMEQKLRPEIKYTYYIIPAIVWIIAIAIMFKNIIMILFIEMIQLTLSTIVLSIIKNIGKKMQFHKVIEFLRDNDIIEK